MNVCGRCDASEDAPPPRDAERDGGAIKDAEPEVLASTDGSGDEEEHAPGWTNVRLCLLPVGAKARSFVHKFYRCARETPRRSGDCGWLARHRCARQRAAALRRGLPLPRLCADAPARRCAPHMRRQVDPKKKDAKGKLYGDGVYCCTTCVAENPKTCPLVRNKEGTSNLRSHLSKRHKKQFQEMEEAAKATPAAAVTSRAPSSVNAPASSSAPGGDGRQALLVGAFGSAAMPKRFVPYTEKQLNNQYTAAMVTKPHNKGPNADQLKLYQMLGFKPPVPSTLKVNEEAFEGMLKHNIGLMLLNDGVIRADGKPLDIPIAHLGFDTTPTGIKSVHAISINLHYLKRTFEPVKIMLKCGAFQLDKADEIDGVTRGSADNLADFVIMVCKEFKLVPSTHTLRKIKEWIFSCVVDNNSPEVKAVADVLGVYVHRCGSHSLDLPIKRVQKLPKRRAGGADADSDADEAQAAYGDDVVEEEPAQSVLRIAELVDLLAKAAAKHGRGKKGALFLRDQELENVVMPLTLITRAATRWGYSSNMIERAVLLRRFMAGAFDRLSLAELTDADWNTLLQSGVILHEAATFNTAMQGRDYLIGDQLGALAQYVHFLEHPELMRVHRPNFEPTVMQINDACRPGRPSVEDTQERFSIWSKDYRKQFAVKGVITDDTDALRSLLLSEMQTRFGDGKKQFSTFPLMLSAALHRYYKALIFDPQQTLWKPEQKAAALRELRMLLSKVGVESESSQAARESLGDSAAAPPRGMLLPLPGARAAQVCTYMDDELEAWKQAPPELMMHAQFWAAQLNGVEARFKKLARVARAVLGVPNTNAECERDFSLAKLLLAAQRKSMSAETFSRKMFLAKNRALWEPNPELK